MKNEPILYSQNLSRISDVRKNLSYCQKLIEATITEFLKLEVHITLIELKSLFGAYRVADIATITEFIKGKMVEGKEGSIKGLQIDTEALKNLVIVPDISALMASLSEFEKAIDSETVFAPDVIYWDFYKIDKTGKVTIAADAMEILTKSFRAYAETKEEKQRLSDALNICETLKQFCISNPGINPGEICNPKLVEFGNNNEFLPSPQFVNSGRI
jgi:hypothetical protein